MCNQKRRNHGDHLSRKSNRGLKKLDSTIYIRNTRKFRLMEARAASFAHGPLAASVDTCRRAT